MDLTNDQEVLQALRDPIPYKWRAQSATQWGATCVAYIDARDVQQRLDDVFGLNWSSEFIPRTVDGSTRMFCRISVTMPNGTVISREDTGTESATEKEKGEVSDAFKRAAVNFGIGRFLYSLGIVRLPKTMVEQKNGRWVPSQNGYNMSAEKITEYCNSQIGHSAPQKQNQPKQYSSSPKPEQQSKPSSKDLVSEIGVIAKQLMKDGLPQGKLKSYAAGLTGMDEWHKASESKLSELLADIKTKKVEDLK